MIYQLPRTYARKARKTIFKVMNDFRIEKRSSADQFQKKSKGSRQNQKNKTFNFVIKVNNILGLT